MSCYRAPLRLCKQLDARPYLRLLSALEIAELRDCRIHRFIRRQPGYVEQLASGRWRYESGTLPSGYAECPWEPRGVVPDAAYRVCCNLGITGERTNRFGCFPEAAPQAGWVAIAPACRQLAAIGKGGSAEWQCFARAVVRSFGSVLTWADEHMQGFVQPTQTPTQPKYTAADRAGNRPLDQALRLIVRGDAAAGRGDLRRAYVEYEASARRLPTPESLTALAWLHSGPMGQGKAHAEELLEQALHLDPRHGPAHHELGRLWAQRGRIEQAAAAFNQAKLAPYFERGWEPSGRWGVFVHHGQMLEAHGRLDSALAQYLMAAHLSGEHKGYPKIVRMVRDLWNKKKALAAARSRSRNRPCYGHVFHACNS